MIKVLIVDDHTSVREAFKAMFEEKDDFCVVGESANANDCVLLCERLSPDIVLLDVCTEGYSSGLVATENIKQNFKDIKVVVMSGFDEISYSPRAKEAGADAFVYEKCSMEKNIFLNPKQFLCQRVKLLLLKEKCKFSD